MNTIKNYKDKFLIFKTVELLLLEKYPLLGSIYYNFDKNIINFSKPVFLKISKDELHIFLKNLNIQNIISTKFLKKMYVYKNRTMNIKFFEDRTISLNSNIFEEMEIKIRYNIIKIKIL